MVRLKILPSWTRQKGRLPRSIGSIVGAALVAAPALAECRRDQSPVTEVTGAFQNICHLSTKRAIRASPYNGSAILYRRQYLITAAHNVYSPFYNPITSLRFACGLSEPTSEDHRSVAIGKTRVASGYFWRRFNRDYAVIRLPEPIDVPQPFRLGEVADGAAPFPVTSAGFPDDSLPNTPMNGWRMFCGTGTATVSAGSPLLNYDVRTKGGNSGGAVWTDGPNGPELVGVHVSGLRNGTGTARAVNATFKAELDRMIDDLEAEQR